MMGASFLGAKSEANPLGYAWRPRPLPRIQAPTDLVGRVHKTTICGTDLHILGGNVPNAKVGLGLGHEGIIDVLEVGEGVKNFKVGDRVLCCCISSCGACKYCKALRMGNCEHPEGSWSLGHTIDGMQCQFVRVPLADGSCHHLPASCERDSEEEDRYLMCADILPTSYEIGLVDGDMADGKTLAVVGAGPVGLACILAARAMYSAKAIVAIDLSDERLALARDMGATHTVQATRGDGAAAAARKAVLDIVGEAEDGVDVVVEAVGLPGGWYLSQEIVKPGGNIAILGVHGQPVTLNLERMWYRNFKMTAGMVHGYSVKALMARVESGELPAQKLVTHRWKLSQVEEAYAAFSERGGVLKVLLTNDGPLDLPTTNKRKRKKVARTNSAATESTPALRKSTSASPASPTQSLLFFGYGAA